MLSAARRATLAVRACLLRAMCASSMRSVEGAAYISVISATYAGDMIRCVKHDRLLSTTGRIFSSFSCINDAELTNHMAIYLQPKPRGASSTCTYFVLTTRIHAVQQVSVTVYTLKVQSVILRMGKTKCIVSNKG